MNEINLLINQFILEGGSLYTLPELYQQLIKQIRSNTASIGEISELLSTDAALNAKILKIANSSLYSFRAEVSTLKQALNLIGLNEVKNLILMDSIANQFINEDDYTIINMKSFWQRSVYLALIAKRLAVKIKHPEPDRLFVSAIMSRIGQLVCCAVRPENVTLILTEYLNSQSPEIIEFDIEKKHMGFTYNEISAQLLKQWKVSEEITHSMQYLHTPLETPVIDKLQQIDSSILNVATIYSGILEFEEKSIINNENNMPITVDVQIYINKVDDLLNQNLKIDRTMVEDILFEIEIDAADILNIIYPNSGLIF